MAESIRYLKKLRIAHLDLKSANLAVAKTLNVKLVDFSESIMRDEKD